MMLQGAYGSQRIPQLISKASPGSDDGVAGSTAPQRSEALTEINRELRSNPISTAQIIRAGFLEKIPSLLLSTDPSIATLASESISILADCPNGRAALLSESDGDSDGGGIIDQAIEALTASDLPPLVKTNMHAAIYGLSSSVMGLRSIVEKDCVEVLVDYASEGTDLELRSLALRTLRNCVRSVRGLTDVLLSSGVEVCLDLMDSEESIIRRDASNLLGSLTFNNRAKETALDHSAAELCLGLIDDPCPKTQTSAMTVLMNVSQTERGKKEIGTTVTMKRLFNVLSNENESKASKLAVLKIAANIAGDPDAKDVINEDERMTSILEGALSSKSSGGRLVRKHARIARDVVRDEK